MKKVGECIKNFIIDEDGIGVVEIILILVVLIGLVILFQAEITSVVKDALDTVSGNAEELNE